MAVLDFGLGTGGGGAPTTGTYIVQTPNAGLSAEQALSLLGTGLLKNTTGTGVLSIATASDIPDLSATYLTLSAAAAAYQPLGSYATLTGAETLTNKTLTTPTIGSFANATHSHLNAAGGGTITAAAISDLATASVAFSNKTGNVSQWTNDASYTTLAAVAGVGYALTSGTLAQFAATTSLQLKTLISDETGSGALVFADTPMILTPTIASFANATHSHLNAAGGGTITAAAVTDLNSATITFTNKSGNISQWTNDSGYLTSVTAHNVLSTTHGDTLAASVTRGDLIIGNSTPKWARLAVGSANSVLSSDGTDVSWSASTGTGNNVRATSPTLTTPDIGVATATSINKLTITAPASSATLTIADGKTFTVNQTLTITGTSGTTMTFPSTSATIARTDAANSFTGAQTITPGGGVTALTVTGATETTSQPLISGTQTWNASGVVFTADLINVTNTASAAGSKLIDRQVGGNSQFNVDKAGVLVLNSGSTHQMRLGNAGGNTSFPGIWFLQASPDFTNYSFLYDASKGVIFNAASGLRNEFRVANTAIGMVDTNGLQLDITRSVAWSSSGVAASSDLTLYRDAADTLAQRRTTTAQKQRIYNTFTTVDTAGEWFKLDWKTTANQFRFGAVKGSSTGTARVATWDYGGAEASPTAAISVPITSGQVTFGGGLISGGTITHGANFMELTEMTAPSAGATNNVRIYAEDNGSGKTRLMALFPTGAAQQIAIEP